MVRSGLKQGQGKEWSSLSEFPRARQYRPYSIISPKFQHSAFCTMRSESWSVGSFPVSSDYILLWTKLTLSGDGVAVPAEHAWVRKAEEGAHSKQSLSWLEHSGQVHLANNPLKPHKEIINSQSACTNTVHTDFILSLHHACKHTVMEKHRDHLLTLALALPLSEDQGLKPQISCTATKAAMHK